MELTTVRSLRRLKRLLDLLSKEGIETLVLAGDDGAGARILVRIFDYDNAQFIAVSSMFKEPSALGGPAAEQSGLTRLERLVGVAVATIAAGALAVGLAFGQSHASEWMPGKAYHPKHADTGQQGRALHSRPVDG